MLANPLGRNPLLSLCNGSATMECQAIDLSKRIDVSEIDRIAFPWRNGERYPRKNGFSTFFYIVQIHDNRGDPLTSLGRVRGTASFFRRKEIKMRLVFSAHT